jgi:polyphosphate kinase
MSTQVPEIQTEIVTATGAAADPALLEQDDSSAVPATITPLEKSTPRAEEAPAMDLDNSALYLNREMSYLQFNLRVLDQARNARHPLLERLMFLLIFSSNLDEFYEIRISGLKKQMEFGGSALAPTASTPTRFCGKSTSRCA